MLKEIQIFKILFPGACFISTQLTHLMNPYWGIKREKVEINWSTDGLQVWKPTPNSNKIVSHVIYFI